MMQAKLFQKQTDLMTSHKYSSVWYRKFKTFHGLWWSTVVQNFLLIMYLQRTELFNNYFLMKSYHQKKFICGKNVTIVGMHSQRDLYNSCMTSPVGIKGANDHLTVLACTNVSGMPKRKLIADCKSKNPRDFRGSEHFLCITEPVRETGLHLIYFLTSLW